MAGIVSPLVDVSYTKPFDSSHRRRKRKKQRNEGREEYAFFLSLFGITLMPDDSDSFKKQSGLTKRINLIIIP